VREREAELEQAGASGCWARIEMSTENPFPFSFFFPKFQSIFK
jgi:hypothetical protein